MPRKTKATAASAVTTNDAEAPTGLTEGELRFIKAVFDNMTQKPDANWDSVAQDLGLKDAKCAKERFRQMSVRHGWREQGTGSATASPRKAGKGAGVTGPSGDGKVVKRAPRTPVKKVKKEEAGDEADDEVDLIKTDDVEGTEEDSKGEVDGEI